MSLVDHSTAIWIVPLQAIYDHVVDLTTVRIAALHWKYSANTRSLEGHTWIKEEIKLYPLSQSFGRQSIVPLVLWSTVSLVLYVGGSLLKLHVFGLLCSSCSYQQSITSNSVNIFASFIESYGDVGSFKNILQHASLSRWIIAGSICSLVPC